MKRVNQILALLLTLLLLVTAVPFAAFGATTATCNHKWINQDKYHAPVKEPANCQHGTIRYLQCSLCLKYANAVTGAENQTFDDGVKNNSEHPEGSLVPYYGNLSHDKPICEAGGVLPGKQCSLCQAVVEQPKEGQPKRDHQAAPGQEATCTRKGVCMYCGKDVFPIDPNNHPADQLEETQAAVEATCTKPGTTAGIRCKACNKTVQAVTVITKDHTGGTATCTKRAKCTACQQEYGEVDPNNHALEKKTGVPATCDTKGTQDYWECKDCHKKFSDEQGTQAISAPVPVNEDPSNHGTKLHKVNANAATCTAAGNIEYWKCDGCQKCFSDANATTEIQMSATVTDKKPHNWGKLTMVSGNCTDGGTATHECADCHTSETVPVTAGSHPTEAWKTTREAKAATCTEAGNQAEITCDLCHTIIQSADVIRASGHVFTGAAATGKGDGTHTFECIKCHQAGEPEACTDENRNCVCDVCKQQLDHVFTNYQPDGNATCLKDGTKTAICDVCGIEKHTITDEGSMKTAEHKYEWTPMNDATCITNGHTKGVCRLCQAETVKEIPDSSKGHVESDWIYSEGYDCTLGGRRHKECTVCGQEVYFEDLEPRAHSIVIDPAVQKTCTVDGKTAGSHCDVCGKIITGQIIFPAEGHKEDANGFVTTKYATCTEDGSHYATCGVCGERFEETIPATGHSETDTIVKPGCTTAGYTLHICSVCGAQRKTDINKPTGHDMVKKVTPATTSKNGKVVQTCSICGTDESYKIYRIKTIKLSRTSYVRDSKSHKPSVTITDSKGNILKNKTDYKLTYSAGRKKIGTYTVTITFIGNYKGEKIKKFKIVPYTVKNVKAKAGVKSATLTWDRNAGADVYNIYCATVKDGKYKKLGSTTKLNFTATGLKTGTTYYFKVYAMRKLDTGNYVSDPSAIRKAKIK